MPPTQISLINVRHRFTHHASRKENPWFDIVQSNVAGNLANSVSDGKHSINLVELTAPEAQFFSHTRNISIV
jgi:hypothetical protein